MWFSFQFADVKALSCGLALDAGVLLNGLQVQLDHTDLKDDLDLSEDQYQPPAEELRGAGDYHSQFSTASVVPRL